MLRLEHFNKEVDFFSLSLCLTTLIRVHDFSLIKLLQLFIFVKIQNKGASKTVVHRIDELPGGLVSLGLAADDKGRSLF